MSNGTVKREADTRNYGQVTQNNEKLLRTPKPKAAPGRDGVARWGSILGAFGAP